MYAKVIEVGRAARARLVELIRRARSAHTLLMLIAVALCGLVMVAVRWGLKREKGRELPVTVVDFRSAPIFGIINWRICGPFVVDQSIQSYTPVSERTILATDYLKKDGGGELPLLFPKEITSVKLSFDRWEGAEPDAKESSGQFLNQNQEFPTPEVSSQQLFWGAFHKFKVIYAASALESPKDQDIAILVPSNSPVKVWLNGAVVIDSAPGPDTHIGAMVHLRKGRNTLLVKEMCFPLRNDFHIWLATRDGANAYIEEQGGLIVPVKQLIAPRGTSLELTTLVDVRYGGAGNAHEATYEIQNEQGEKVISGDLAEVHEKAVNLGSLPDGLYYLILSNDQTRDRVAFFFGDITQRVREVGSYCTAHARSGLPCDAIPRLLQTLNDPKCGFDLGKQNIAVFLLSQFEGDVLNDGQSKRNVGAVDRIRLMSFRSQMDGSTQHYYMYTPPEVNDGSPSPLVVIVPHNSLTTPFFDNDPTINPFPLQQYASYARRYHLAFIQPFARGARLPSAAGEADILEAIQAARAHYPVDMTRLYLAGDCAGGRSALLMAENFPELFPVVSTIDASTSHFTHLTRTKRDAGNVLLRLRNLRKTFVGLIQEDPDPHSPEEQARILVAQAQEFRFTPDLVILPVDRAPTREYTRQKMFEYLAEHSSCHAQQPMHVDLAIIDFRNRHAYWITVNRLAVAGMPAYVSAELQSRGVIDIKSENVLSLSLDIGKMPDDVKVINGWSIAWNGKHFNSVVASDGMHRQIMLDAEAPRGRPTKGASGAVL